MDSEGYLTLTGRLKKIINRGGEKISRRESDEILLDHPAVAQVVTLTMPHDSLGEKVAAAVVLAEVTEAELWDFVSQGKKFMAPCGPGNWLSKTFFQDSNYLTLNRMAKPLRRVAWRRAA